MKKVYLSILILSFYQISNYQIFARGLQIGIDTGILSIDTVKHDIAKAIRDANDLKTGNWQDVLTNFFQLSLSDLSGPNRALNFKSSLFALKLKTNSSINVDTNYVRHNFDRNFQFNFSLKLDSQFKFNRFSGGIAWAAINKRDTTLISCINNDINNVWLISYSKLDNLIIQYRKLKNPSHTGKEPGFNKTDSLIKQMMASGVFELDSFPGLEALSKPFNFRDSLNAILKAGLSNVYAYYDSVKQNTLLKPLLTFSLTGAVNNQSRFDSAQFGIIYLQGLTKKGKHLELDIRASLGTKDTLINNGHYRTIFNSSAGLNYTLITNDKSKSSVLEIKPYFEYDKIFNGLLPGENADKFLANVDLRLRISQNLWIPFTIKYDLKSSSFLGFLNVSANLSALKSLSKILK